MVTYCIGSARQKREYFAESDAVVLDNVEVLFCASEEGRNCFAFGDLPFGSFTVGEYISYRRALCSAPPDMELLKSFGIAERKKIRRLSPVEMRCVAFIEKTSGRTDRAVVINLDGTKYTRRNNALLKKLLAVIDDAYVCISDAKFLTNAEPGCKTLSFGAAGNGRPRFFAARRLAKKIGAKRIAVM